MRPTQYKSPPNAKRRDANSGKTSTMYGRTGAQASGTTTFAVAPGFELVCFDEPPEDPQDANKGQDPEAAAPLH
eukprot:CAMPEP_0204117692 /NCGR_PEP_ID=MMETSP0361-20130328/6124_1 /ASSEMBLY_ACC=CAM_ASM_000343 /TAXON_ID=268821 /ORGANISM="Scrippsiella Hangoei, Strain SHTV-5" /LENGTH=73 /DNA_ID=CAMNT_0051068627 /DNA_START=108 /DNA_END=329 /DNA_ORIENTATION=-